MYLRFFLPGLGPQLRPWTRGQTHRSTPVAPVVSLRSCDCSCRVYHRAETCTAGITQQVLCTDLRSVSRYNAIQDPGGWSIGSGCFQARHPTKEIAGCSCQQSMLTPPVGPGLTNTRTPASLFHPAEIFMAVPQPAIPPEAGGRKPPSPGSREQRSSRAQCTRNEPLGLAARLSQRSQAQV